MKSNADVVAPVGGRGVYHEIMAYRHVARLCDDGDWIVEWDVRRARAAGCAPFFSEVDVVGVRPRKYLSRAARPYGECAVVCIRVCEIGHDEEEKVGGICGEAIALARAVDMRAARFKLFGSRLRKSHYGLTSRILLVTAWSGESRTIAFSLAKIHRVDFNRNHHGTTALSLELLWP